MSPVLILAPFGLICGWLRGGGLEHLGRAHVRWLWIVPAAFAIQVFIALGLGTAVPPWVFPVHLGTYFVLGAFMVANWRHRGLRIMSVGLAMNALVIALNGGLMPQSPETLYLKHPGETYQVGDHVARTKDVVLPREQTRLWWLSDVLASPPWSSVQTVMSVGDVVLAIGLAWTVQELMQPQRRAVSSWPRASAGGIGR